MTTTAQTHSVGMIIRQKEPANLETSLAQVDAHLTPTGLFYIRSHFPAPGLDRGSKTGRNNTLQVQRDRRSTIFSVNR